MAMKKLTGDELLKQVKIAEATYEFKSEQALACGYTDMSEYYDALLVAKGLATISSCITCGNKKRVDRFGLPI